MLSAMARWGWLRWVAGWLRGVFGMPDETLDEAHDRQW